MIVYNLTCENEHRFEGWFSSPDDYQSQNKNQQIACPQCSSLKIRRVISTPYVNTKTNKTKRKIGDPKNQSNFIEKNTAIREHLLKELFNSTEDVGENFPEEARKIHYQEEAARPIRGKASKKEVIELQEEGIDVVPIPNLNNSSGVKH